MTADLTPVVAAQAEVHRLRDELATAETARDKTICDARRAGALWSDLEGAGLTRKTVTLALRNAGLTQQRR